MNVLRHQRYNEMVSKAKIDLDPSILPPSPRAAYYHGLRVYHQTMVWVQLSATDLNPLKSGWSLKNILEPIKTDLAPAPDHILKVIRCSCKSGCSSNRCFCKRNGLQCTLSCTECNGITCKNCEKIDSENIMEDLL